MGSGLLRSLGRSGAREGSRWLYAWVGGHPRSIDGYRRKDIGFGALGMIGLEQERQSRVEARCDDGTWKSMMGKE